MIVTVDESVISYAQKQQTAKAEMCAGKSCHVERDNFLKRKAFNARLGALSRAQGELCAELILGATSCRCCGCVGV